MPFPLHLSLFSLFSFSPFLIFISSLLCQLLVLSISPFLSSLFQYVTAWLYIYIYIYICPICNLTSTYLFHFFFSISFLPICWVFSFPSFFSIHSTYFNQPPFYITTLYLVPLSSLPSYLLHPLFLFLPTVYLSYSYFFLTLPLFFVSFLSPFFGLYFFLFLF